jgi:hypothetical protein
LQDDKTGNERKIPLAVRKNLHHCATAGGFIGGFIFPAWFRLIRLREGTIVFVISIARQIILQVETAQSQGVISVRVVKVYDSSYILMCLFPVVYKFVHHKLEVAASVLFRA